MWRDIIRDMKRGLVAFGAAAALAAGSGCEELAGAEVNDHARQPARTWQISDVCSVKDSSGTDVAIGALAETTTQRLPVSIEDIYSKQIRTTEAYVTVTPDTIRRTPIVGVEQTAAGEELLRLNRRLQIALGGITITLSGRCENGWGQGLPQEQPVGSLTGYTHFYPPNIGRPLNENELPPTVLASVAPVQQS